MASILNDHLNSPESLTAALIKGNDAAWQQYTQHPFFQHIINGTLLPHQFDFFLEQQLHYYEELKTMYAAAAENTALKKLGFNYQDNATMLNHDIAALKTRNNGFSSRKNKVISEYGRYYLNLTAPAVSDEEESQFAALLLHVAKLPCWLGYTTIALNSTITTNTPNSSQQWLLQYATIDELVSSLKKDTQASLLFNLCKPQDNELKILLAVFKKSLDYEQQFLDSIILHQAQRGMSR
jgi:thiaminase